MNVVFCDFVLMESVRIVEDYIVVYVIKGFKI